MVVEVVPSVQDAPEQGRVGQQLDLDLKAPGAVVMGLDVDDAELVGQKLAFVVGVEDLHLGHRVLQIGTQDSVEEMDQQVTVLLRPQEGLEDTVDLGVDGVAHGGSLGRIGDADIWAPVASARGRSDPG